MVYIEESVLLPKPDKRYKVGSIKLDKNGRYRGHPDTVDLKHIQIPQGAPITMQMNPPFVISRELATLDLT